MIIKDLHILIINTETGEILRELQLDPTKDHQPRGMSKGFTFKK